MPDASDSKSRRRLEGGPRRLNRIVIILVALVALVVALYFVITSGAFLKAVVLPRVASAMNARLAVDEVSLSPLSSLELKNVRVDTLGDQPLLRADGVTVRYRLFSLVSGNIDVPEIALSRPEINVQVGADGKSNLDPLLGTSQAAPPPRAKTEAPQVNVGSVTVRGGALTYCQRGADGSVQCSTLTNLDFTLSNLQNGATGKVSVSSIVAQINSGPSNRLDQVRGKLTGDGEFSLNAKLEPQGVKGNFRFDVAEATGDLKDLAGGVGTVDVEYITDELRQLRLRLQRQGQALGEVRLYGPLALERKEGRINFQVNSVGAAALKLVGAPLGLDFGDTALSASGFCDIAAAGQRYTADVNLKADKFSLQRGELVTPVLDFQMELRGNADLSAKTAYLEKCSLTGKSGGKDLVSFATEQAVNVAWNREEARRTAPAIMKLALSDLNLAQWRPVLGTNVLDGTVNLAARITSEEDGRRLSLDFTNTVRGLNLAFGERPLRDLQTLFSGRLTVGDFQTVGLDRCRFEYGEAGATLLTSTVSASYDTKVNSGNLQITANGELPALLARHPVPELAFQRGSLRVNTLLNWNNDQYSGGVSFLVGDAAGAVGGYKLDGYTAQFDADAELARNKLTFRRLGLSAREGIRSGGSADLVGQLDGTTRTGQFDLHVVGLNETALRPFVTAFLTGRDLASVTLNADGQVRYDAKGPADSASAVPVLQQTMTALAEGVGETALQIRAGVTNLVLRDRATLQATPPLGFGMVLDTTRRGGVYELGTNQLQLAPTQRGQNLLTLSGKVDLSPTNPAPSTLLAHADSLDFTPWFDAFMAASAATNTAPTQPATPAVSPVTPETEPPPISVPIKQLTAELKVGSLYVRDIVVQNWTAKAVLDHDKLTVDPFALTVNNAAVAGTAKLDLTKPGYAYELGLNADKILLEPIVNSMATNYAGQIKGDMYAKLNLTGAGITGPSLQKNLRGQAMVNLTNLNLQVFGPRTKKILTTLATALRLQDLATSPLTLISANMDIADGNVAIRPFQAASDAFYASADGSIHLAPVLTNSTVDLPVNLALREDLARQFKVTNLTPSSRTNFLTLPQFVKIEGTVGEPDTQIDKLRVAALLAGGVGGALGGDAGAAAQGIGSLLQGDTKSALGTLNNFLQKTPGATNAPTTNAPAQTKTNASPVQDVLGILKALEKKKN